MPKVDIIIPAYNAAKFLSDAIQSVIAQTFDDWRIILIDDGSTDNTPEIAQQFIEQLGAKLMYIRQPNAGLPAARNAAIRNSSAELLALLDADDIWLPSRLADSVACFEGRPQVGLAYAFNSRVDASGALIDTFARRQKHAEGRIAPYIYMRMVDLPCPTITFRRSAVDEVGLFDETLRATEDRDLWLRIAQRYEVALIPKVLALYRTSPDAMTTDPDRMLRAQQQFIDKHFGAPGCGRVARRIALARIYKQRAEALALRNQVPAALGSAMRALAYYPLDLNNVRTAGSLLLRRFGRSTA
jgi:glycosyltransferase involved in cell wall biosynthesis